MIAHSLAVILHGQLRSVVESLGQFGRHSGSCNAHRTSILRLIDVVGRLVSELDNAKDAPVVAQDEPCQFPSLSGHTLCSLRKGHVGAHRNRWGYEWCRQCQSTLAIGDKKEQCLHSEYHVGSHHSRSGWSWMTSTVGTSEVKASEVLAHEK